jgi:PAS domain S-box-containing protein
MAEGTIFAEVAQDPRLRVLTGDLRPSFIWSGDGRVPWSNELGAALLGFDSRDVAADRATLIHPGLTPHLAAILRTLPSSGAPRLERVRFGLEAVACACRSFRASDGSRMLLVTALEVPRWLKSRPAPGAAPHRLHAVPTTAEQSARNSWEWVAADDARPAGELDRAEVTGEQDLGGRAPAGIEAPSTPPAKRNTSLRFVFQTDPAGCFVLVSKELQDVLGAAGNWAGRTFDEVASSAGLRGAEAVRHAFQSQSTWISLAFTWRDEEAGQSTRIEMSAVPQFDGGRSFLGFRGFGLCRPPLPIETVAVASDGPAAEDVGGMGGAGSAGLSEDVPAPVESEGTVTTPAASIGVPEAAETPRLEETRTAPVAEQPTLRAEAEVIAIANGKVPRGSADGKIIRLHAKSALPERPALSPSEKTAFREIARALGARLEGDETASLHMAGAMTGNDASISPVESSGHARRAPDESSDLAAWGNPHDDDGQAAEDIVSSMRRQLSAEMRPALAPATTPDPPPGVPISLVDRLPIGILVAKGEEVLFANHTLLALLGFSSLEELASQGGLDRIFAGRSLGANLGDASQGDSAEGDSPVLLTAADGGTIAVEARIQTTRWHGESAVLLSFRRPLEADLKERARSSEDAARRAERRADELQTVLDTATDGVVILDGEGRIIGVNRSAEALFGYEAGDIAGKGMLMLFAPESHRAAFDYLDSLKSNGVASVLNDGREVMGRVRQGGLVPLFMTIGRLGDTDGNRFCAVLRDMTSFKKAESELLSAKREAEDASSQKSDFLAKISHEIRTPLSAIIGFAEVMMEERFGPVGNDRYRVYVRDIHASGGHVISLVNDLLDLSKIEAGKLDLTFTSVSLNDIVQQCVGIMQAQAGRDRIIIRTALAPNMPNVVADSRSMRQIALNLLSNSIKFTMPGGQVIVSSTVSEKGEAVLRVRDTGVGMTDKELSIAMEPFRQVSNSSLGGTGLGLPLTKALVEANRASFSIQSAKNAGTIVEVAFPSTRVLAE